jgi:hypothetical protein
MQIVHTRCKNDTGELPADNLLDLSPCNALAPWRAKLAIRLYFTTNLMSRFASCEPAVAVIEHQYSPGANVASGNGAA